MIGGDRLCGGEPSDMGLGFDDLFGRIAHLAQPRGLLLSRAQNDVVRLDLPDIETQRQIDQPREWRRLRRIRTNRINDVHPCDSSSSLSFVSFASRWSRWDSNLYTNASTV